MGELLHERGHKLAVAVAQVVEHALEVAGDEDVHARRDGGEERALAVVDAGGEEVVEHVVLIARHDELGNGQAQELGVVAGEHVAEVARGHAELDLVARLDGTGAQKLRVCGKVVDNLRHQAPNVDGVSAAEHHAALGQALCELAVGEDALDGALGVVEVAAHAAHRDVAAGLGGHLEFLNAAHLALGVEDGDACAGSVRKTGERSLARVARGGGYDHDVLCRSIRGASRPRHEARQHLQGHVLEGARGAVEELEHEGLAALFGLMANKGHEGGDFSRGEGAVVRFMHARGDFIRCVIR